MKAVKIVVAIILLALAVSMPLQVRTDAAPAKPDLTATFFECHWPMCKGEVKNIGSAKSGPFMIYIDAEESVNSKERMQLSFSIPGLAVNGIITLKHSQPVNPPASIYTNFTPLLSAKNSFGHNVIKVILRIDPKNTVNELNENNNVFMVPVIQQ